MPLNHVSDRQIKRNVWIFLVLMLGTSILSGVLMSSGLQEAALLFLLPPFLLPIILRQFCGDSWRDAGLRFRLKTQWPLLALVLLLPILLFVVVLGAGLFTGFAVASMPLDQLGLHIGLQLSVGYFAFAFFEEWGWRGYLEPQLSKLGIVPLKRHFAVGVIWGLWHIPFFWGTGLLQDMPIFFAPLHLLGSITLAYLYGRLRSYSGSMWPPFLLHGASNMLFFSIAVPNQLVTFLHPFWLEMGPNSVGSILVWAALTSAVWFRLNN